MRGDLLLEALVVLVVLVLGRGELERVDLAAFEGNQSGLAVADDPKDDPVDPGIVERRIVGRPVVAPMPQIDSLARDRVPAGFAKHERSRTDRVAMEAPVKAGGEVGRSLLALRIEALEGIELGDRRVREQVPGIVVVTGEWADATQYQRVEKIRLLELETDRRCIQSNGVLDGLVVAAEMWREHERVLDRFHGEDDVRGGERPSVGERDLRAKAERVAELVLADLRQRGGDQRSGLQGLVVQDEERREDPAQHAQRVEIVPQERIERLGIGSHADH